MREHGEGVPALSPTHTSPAAIHCLCTVLPSLIPLVVTSDPWLRHGALHAVSEVVISLYHLHSSPSPHTLTDTLGAHLVQDLIAIVPKVGVSACVASCASWQVPTGSVNMVPETCCHLHC